MMQFRSIRFALGVGLAGFFLWLTLRGVHLADVVSVVSHGEVGWILLAVLSFAVGYACRIERWRLMLRNDNPHLRWRDCAGPLLAGFAVNNLLPMRAGDVLRAFAFGATLGATSGTVIATLFVERLFDLAMVLVFLGLAIHHFGLDVSSVAGVGSAFLLGIALVIALALSFPSLFRPPALALVRLIERVTPHIGRRLGTEVRKALDTLTHLGSGRSIFRLFVWSALVWVAEGLVFFSAALALPSILRPAAGWLALPVGTLATLVPSTPGYVGTFDFFTARAMTAVGNAPVASTAYALSVHILLWLPPTLTGGAYLVATSMRVRSALHVGKR